MHIQINQQSHAFKEFGYVDFSALFGHCQKREREKGKSHKGKSSTNAWLSIKR